MSGGRIAISGFDYQAIVILEQLFDHFDKHAGEGWRKMLEDVLPANMRWYHRQNIVRVLESDPGSYVTIESRLSREENWVHFNRCEINSLDEAAERLFHKVH